ncbi:hypothetical protein S245_021650, partial [Arachis hypogaea]
SKLETDRILKLVPEWPKSVQDWSFLILIEPLVGKIFENLSNATVVKLLIYICEDLANVADLFSFESCTGSFIKDQTAGFTFPHIQGKDIFICQTNGSAGIASTSGITECIKQRDLLFVFRLQ